MIKFIRESLLRWKTFKAELKERSTLKYVVVDLLETIVVALILALIIRKYVIQTSLVPSGSMIPTLKIGDRLFVNKFVYRFRDPVPGDIVVFRSTQGDDKDYVKRCVAVGGQSVEVKNGILFVDDAVASFPGVVIQRDYSELDRVLVPEDMYFMMGDNRGNSFDSRSWGFVPEKKLLGKALFTFWPISNIQVLR